jgi:hypothetical protein
VFAAFSAARARRHEERAALARSQEREDLDHLLAWADQVRQGTVVDSSGFITKPNEVLVLSLPRASLVEERSLGGHFASGSQGFSIPVGSIAGRSVRYRVGRTKGHYVKGTPTPTAIDHGTLVITSARIVFLGTHQERDCPLEHLNAAHCDHDGRLALSVAGRQHAIEIYVGAGAGGLVSFCVDLALARHRDEEESFLATVRARRNALVAQ